MADVVNDETRGKTYSDVPNLEPWILNQLNQLKIKQPTPIQYNCIPPALEGRDVIGAAKTGSGKTLAFVIPILQQLSVDPYGIYALILTPTRELAFQIGDQFRGLGAPMSLRLSVIVGGLDMVAQGAELSRSPHIVVATPGRLADILECSPDFTLKRIKFLVLDEADRLMDGRFDAQLRVIWSALPEKRQTLLFSATITDRLQKMRELATSEVFVWQSKGSNQATVQQLDERYALVNPIVKDATMVALVLEHIEKKPKGLIIIFTHTCKSTQILCMMLNALGVESVALHSMISQKERLSALARFKSSQVRVLIATDLGSRGLDIPMVELVINHNIPNLPKNYIHRVGRTARAGRSGQAVLFATPNEIKLLLAIETETRRKMSELKVDEAVVRKIMKQVNVTKREQEIKLDQSDFDERRNINKRKRAIMEGRDPDAEEKQKQKQLKKLRREQRQEREILLQKIKSGNVNILGKKKKKKDSWPRKAESNIKKDVNVIKRNIINSKKSKSKKKKTGKLVTSR